MSTNGADHQSLPGSFYLDSGCTVHVTTGDAEMIELRKSKIKMSGPFGEIMTSTNAGTIVFPCGDNTILFKDALVVPSLERNLLSLSKILDSNPDLFVVFNKDRFEGFKGQLSGVGTTLFQGQKDSSNLFALLSDLDDTKVIVSAEAEPIADVQVNDCVLNTGRIEKFVEVSTSSNFSHVSPRADAPILETMDGDESKLQNESSTNKIDHSDLDPEAQEAESSNFSNLPGKVFVDGILEPIFAG